jgi:hypothetical protein
VVVYGGMSVVGGRHSRWSGGCWNCLQAADRTVPPVVLDIPVEEHVRLCE